MKNRTLYLIWAGLFALCAGLGFLPEPAGAGKGFCVLMSLAFFLPPVLLALRGDGALVRNLAIAALAVDSVLLVANIASVVLPEGVGTVLHYMLVIAGSPLICSQNWALTLFLWACIMIFAGNKAKKA